MSDALLKCKTLLIWVCRTQTQAKVFNWFTIEMSNQIEKRGKKHRTKVSQVKDSNQHNQVFKVDPNQLRRINFLLIQIKYIWKEIIWVKRDAHDRYLIVILHFSLVGWCVPMHRLLTTSCLIVTIPHSFLQENYLY